MLNMYVLLLPFFDRENWILKQHLQQVIDFLKFPIIGILRGFIGFNLSLKFIYSEKATNFCEISTVDLTGTTYDIYEL